MHKILRLPYRCLQRVMVLEGVVVLCTGTDSCGQPSGGEPEARQLTRAEVAAFIERGEAPYCDTLLPLFDGERAHCFGVVRGDALQSFAWLHRGSAPAELNQGRSPKTATAVALEESAAFVFHAYTRPEARGQLLLQEVLRRAAGELQETHGVTDFVTTTELVNDSARAAFRRAEFEEIGSYWRYGVGRFIGGCYPRPTGPVLGYGPDAAV